MDSQRIQFNVHIGQRLRQNNHFRSVCMNLKSLSVAVHQPHSTNLSAHYNLILLYRNCLRVKTVTSTNSIPGFSTRIFAMRSSSTLDDRRNNTEQCHVLYESNKMYDRHWAISLTVTLDLHLNKNPHSFGPRPRCFICFHDFS